jgi:hypothetical protein
MGEPGYQMMSNVFMESKNRCVKMYAFGSVYFRDYHQMSLQDLQERLEFIARISMEKQEFPPYVLLADNLIKMALILLRVQGCSKVISLVRKTRCLFIQMC